MGVSAAWTFPGKEFCDFAIAVGGDDGSARSISHGCVCARGGRPSAIASPFQPKRSGAGWSRFVARSFSFVGADAGRGYRSGGFGPKQFSRYVLDHDADADPSRKQWL